MTAVLHRRRSCIVLHVASYTMQRKWGKTINLKVTTHSGRICQPAAALHLHLYDSPHEGLRHHSDLFMYNDKVPNKTFFLGLKFKRDKFSIFFTFFLFVFANFFVWISRLPCLFIIFKLLYWREETGRSVVFLHVWSV